MSGVNRTTLVTSRCVARRRIAGMGTSPAVLKKIDGHRANVIYFVAETKP